MMIHDQALVDRLSALPVSEFAGEVFRATRPSADPLAPSVSGGRWSPPPVGDTGVSALYTSLDSDGATAEVASFLADLTPPPRERLIKVSRLGVAFRKSLRLTRAGLPILGVDMARFGERDYSRTQQIGAALAFLGLDGLIAPSARWPCDNLVIFSDNHSIADRLEVIDHREVGWRAWATSKGMILA